MPDKDQQLPIDEPLLDLALAIADGTLVDWSAAIAPVAVPVKAPGESDSGLALMALIGRLQQIERLVRGHQAVCLQIGPPAAGAGETILSQARSQGRLSPDGSLRVQWGPLVVLEKVGCGSFGDVYRAWDPRLEREVALKLVPEATTESESSPVVEEGRLLARVRHPNVLTVYGAERIDGRAGIWTEYLPGETLAQEVVRRGALPPDEAARIGADVCAALAAVHAAGVLHRDVKAQNVMRDATGRIVLGDFGTGVHHDPHRVSGPQMAGTPLYVAPEVLNGERATRQSDLYSVGVLLYFLVTGDYPVRGKSLAEIVEAHGRRHRVPLSAARQHLPAEFVSIVEGLCSVPPDRRPDDAGRAEASLRAWLAGSAQGGELTRPVASGSRRAILAASAVVLFVAVSAVLAWRTPIQPPLKLDAGDWIIIAGFDNQTGEEIFDGGVEAAVKRELEYSSYIRVLQPARIQDSLLLLDRPISTRLDPRFAREVALKDGGVRAIVTGRIQRHGAMYAITFEIANPRDGVVSLRINDSANLSEIPGVVRRDVLTLRERIGEPPALVAQSRRTLSDQTIVPLTALRLYARAAALFHEESREVPIQEDASGVAGISAPEGQRRLRDAEQQLRAAVRDAPDFARAWALLDPVVAMQNQRPIEPWRGDSEQNDNESFLDRAWRLVDHASPQERLAIEGDVHNARAGNYGGPDTDAQRSELEQAVAAYEALLALQPDTADASALGNIYNRLGRGKDAALMDLRQADARPRNARLNATAGNALLRQGQFEAARRYAARAVSTLSPAAGNRNSVSVASALLMDGSIAWLQDDLTEAIAATDRVVANSDHLPPALAREVRLRAWPLYLAMGRAREAAAVIERLWPTDVDDPAYAATESFAAISKGILLTETGQRGELRRFAMTHWRNPLPPDAPLASAARGESLIEAGLLDMAERDTEWFLHRTSRFNPPLMRPYRACSSASLEFALGRPLAAISTLTRAIPAIARNTPFDMNSRLLTFGGALGEQCSALLAAALDANGNLPMAIAVLEQALSDRIASSVLNAPNRWMRGRAQLARLYRKSGQQQRARTIEAQLLKLLALADSDFPLARELRALQ